MVAYSFASQFPESTSHLVWGECPIPGTTAYEVSKTSPLVWHFMFQAVPDLPEALVQGREDVYLQHFYDKTSYNSNGITPADAEVYYNSYRQPGAMRCAFAIYKSFEIEKESNLKSWKEKGKVKVPTLVLNGDKFRLAATAAKAAEETSENAEVKTVQNAGHYVAEENPVGFVDSVLEFIGRV
jgi:pimeloyl-ACP methyl ester carboxylesterase